MRASVAAGDVDSDGKVEVLAGYNDEGRLAVRMAGIAPAEAREKPPTDRASAARMVRRRMEAHGPKLEELLADHAWFRGIARGLVPASGADEDLTQDAWVAALDGSPSLDRPLRPWLGGVVRRLSSRRRRSDARRRRREDSHARPEALPSTAEMIERVDTQRHVAGALLALEEPFRATLLLRFFEGKSSADIARHEGIPEGTVRWRVKEGLERLRGRLDRRFGGGRAAWIVGVGSWLETPHPETAASTPLGAFTGAVLVSGWTQIAVGVLVSAVVLGALWATRSDPPRAPVADAASPSVVEREPGSVPDRTSQSVATVESGAGRTASAARGPELAPAAEIAVEARFVDSDGRGIAGVLARFEAPLAEQYGESDAEGRLRIELGGAAGLRDGGPRNVRLRTHHAAYVAATRNVFLPVGETVLLGEIELEPGGALSGFVTDEEGAPVAGATVRLARFELTDDEIELGSLYGFPEPPFEAGFETRTEVDGTFELAGVAVGPKRVAASADGRLGAVSQRVDVVAGELANDVRLVLPSPEPWRAIRGRVIDSDGVPVPGALVEHGPATRARHAWRTERASAVGEFEVRLDRREPWTLRASSPDAPQRATELAGVEPGADDVLLRLGVERWVRVIPRESSGPIGGSVRVVFRESETGVVLGTAWTGPRSSSGDDASAGVMTFARGPDAEGVRMPVPDAPFSITLSADGYEDAEAGPFAPAAVPAELVVSMTRAKSGVVGGIVLAEGRPVAGAFVVLAPQPEPGSTWFRATDREGDVLRFVHRYSLSLRGLSRTDAEGKFALEYPSAGSYLLVVTHATSSRERLWTSSTRPLVLASTLEEPLLVELTRGGAIEGEVLLPAERDTAGVIVGASRGDGLVFTAVADSQGRYRIGALAPGAWQVGRMDAETVFGIEVTGSRPVAREGELPFDCTVSEGSTTRFDLDLREPGDECTLRASLTVDGEPAEAWTVSMKAEGSKDFFAFKSTKTDIDGRLELVAREPGAFIVSLSATLRGTLVSYNVRVDLARGLDERAWSLDTAVLAGRRTGDPESWGEYLFHYAEPTPDAWTLAAFRADGEGSFEVGAVPVGPGRIVRRGEGEAFLHPSEWSTILEVEARPGETAFAEIP